MTENRPNMRIQPNELESKRQEILRAHQIAVTTSTPQESRITDLIDRELLSTEWAHNTFADIKKLLIAFYKESLARINDQEFVHDRTQKLLGDIAERGKAKIVSGKENLAKVPKKSPVFLMTNHLGLYKLSVIRPQYELGLNDFGAEKMFPLPLFHAANKPVADALEDGLYIGAFQFPGKTGEIQRLAGGVIIRLEDEEKLEADTVTGLDHLTQETRRFVKDYSAGALSVLPEGGTSGKRSGRGPYDLEPFRTGAFVVAARLNIPILPVTQYFHPRNGFELAVHPPFILDVDLTRGEFREIAERTRMEMQAFLDTKKK